MVSELLEPENLDGDGVDANLPKWTKSKTRTPKSAIKHVFKQWKRNKANEKAYKHFDTHNGKSSIEDDDSFTDDAPYQDFSDFDHGRFHKEKKKSRYKKVRKGVWKACRKSWKYLREGMRNYNGGIAFNPADTLINHLNNKRN